MSLRVADPGGTGAVHIVSTDQLILPVVHNPSARRYPHADLRQLHHHRHRYRTAQRHVRQLGCQRLPARPPLRSRSTDTTVATIGVGWTPTQVAVSPDGARAYVTASGAGTVSVIDTATNTVTTTIPVGTNPTAVTLPPHGLRLNTGAGTVSVINTAANTVATTITVGTQPYSIALSADGTRAYVTNTGSGTVSVINTATNTVTAVVKVGSIGRGRPAAWWSAPTHPGVRGHTPYRRGRGRPPNNTVLAKVTARKGPDTAWRSADGATVAVSAYPAVTRRKIETATDTARLWAASVRSRSGWRQPRRQQLAVAISNSPSRRSMPLPGTGRPSRSTRNRENGYDTTCPIRPAIGRSGSSDIAERRRASSSPPPPPAQLGFEHSPVYNSTDGTVVVTSPPHRPVTAAQRSTRTARGVGIQVTTRASKRRLFDPAA